ncbi:MAG: Fur family transcriptional regulator [Pseudomonadota bacterium]
MTHLNLQPASEYCETNGYRLTKPRLEVLKIISSSAKPIGAYEVLEKLGSAIKNPKPPTVYRAIDFWKDQGFIHRIESLNAYVACEAGHRHKGSQFMICNDCGLVIETHLCELPEALKNSTIENTFAPSRWNFEIHGVCKDCG